METKNLVKFEDIPVHGVFVLFMMMKEKIKEQDFV